MIAERETLKSLSDRLLDARRDLKAKPDGVLEELARTHSLSMSDVLALLPAAEAVEAKGVVFERVWAELAEWGEILFLIHNAHGVFEIRTALAQGSWGHGYFNLAGGAALGGHLRGDACRSIWLVDRALFGRRSCSVQFLDAAGEVMFKVFVRRDAARELDREQCAKFEALRQSL